MAAADEERTLAGVLLVLQRIAAFRLFAVGHGLVQRGHGGAEQFHQMRAGFQTTDLAPHRFTPARADALADQARKDRFDLDAGRVGRRAHHRFCLADGHALVDRQPQADIVHGIARLQFAAKTVGALGQGLCVAQPCLDFPKPVVAQKAFAFDDTRMHQAARFVAIFQRHQFISCIDASRQPNLTIILPSADRDCMVLNASRKFSNGTTLPTTGCNWPDASQSNNCAIKRACVSGSRFWIWARSTPSSAPPFNSGRLNASAGMVPEAKPTTRCRPRQAIERNACSATSPPTGSKITSGPWPPVNSFSVSRQSAL